MEKGKSNGLRKVDFVLAEDLPQEKKEEYGIEKGLVALELSINPPPKIKALPIKGDNIISYWLNKLNEDGVTNEELQHRIEVTKM